MTSPLVHDKVWLDKNKCDEAERQYFEKLAKLVSNGISKPCPLDTQASDLSKVGGTSKRVGSKDSTKRAAKNGGSLPTVDKKDRNSNSSISKKEQSAQVNKTNASRDVSESLFPTPNPTVASLSEKRLKPKDVKEKRNKADKKGSENRILVKDDVKGTPNTPQNNSLAGEVAKARQHIKNSLECMDNLTTLTGSANIELVNKINSLEKENATFHKKLETLDSLVVKLEARIKSLEIGGKVTPATTAAKPSAPAAAKKTDDDDDDGVDLFGSDSEDESEEAKKVREARVSAYTAKKSNKPALIAKSNIILDVKPWDDETDMKKMEQEVRKVTCDGLLWGASKLVPLAYGIHKLQISCVVEDDKVSIDWLQETLELIEDFVQSVDIAAFNKV